MKKTYEEVAAIVIGVAALRFCFYVKLKGFFFTIVIKKGDMLIRILCT